MDLPNASSLSDVTRKGYLQKLSSRSFPYMPHPWKRKYCVLVKSDLYYYEREDSKGVDKGAGVISLQYYDQVVEAAAKDSKKASNVFVLTSQDKNFFDQKHLFSAESGPCMQEWIKVIKKNIQQTRNNNKNTAAAVIAGATALNPRSAANNRNSTGTKPAAGKTKAADETKAKKRQSAGEEITTDNKENIADSSTDTSQRRRKAEGRGSGGEEVLEAASPANFYSLGRRKKSATDTQQQEPPSGHSSLGRNTSGVTKKAEKDGSLGRMGGKGKENKKRKADDEEEMVMESAESGPQLESVTKHRVKGPAGRRMPQNRRAHQLMVKHRASSLSALAHDPATVDTPSTSFVPWLNRSLDLLGEDELQANSQQNYGGGVIYSDQEDFDDVAMSQMYDPHSAAFGENISFDDNTTGIYIDDGFSNLNLSTGGVAPPPLPPRMESRMDYSGQQNPFHVQQHNPVQLMQYQAALMQTQMRSPYGTMQGTNRKSQPDMSELFISSYSEENSSEGAIQSAEGMTQRRQPRPKSVGAKINAQRARKGQPDMNRFTIAVRNLQKHVVELDQAVNEITKEVEDSKAELGNVKTTLGAVKKEREKLQDSLLIVSQEATKIKDQVSTSLKEAEKLQKTATSALVVAEKAKIDQQNLKKEYENLLRHMKSTISDLKKEALKASISAPSTIIYQKLHGNSSDQDEDISGNEEYYDDEEDEKKSDKNAKSKKQGFFSRPSSIISGLTGRSSLTKSSTSLDAGDKDKNKDCTDSPNKNKEKRGREKTLKSESKPADKNLKKDTRKMRSSRSVERDGKKVTRSMSDDFPMMDDSTSPRARSPVQFDHIEPNSFHLGKSTSSPTRPRRLNLKPQKFDGGKKSSEASSPDSPTRSTSPFDVPKVQLNGRAASPTRSAILRQAASQGPLSRQGSMTTVPEDRVIDSRTYDNRPSEPPPPPPANRVFAISRQSSSPNIATQKSSPLTLTKQHSLGVLLEDPKNPMSRQSSVSSMIDDRPIGDQTLPMSPAGSLMSFPGSWSTTSLNRQDSATALNGPDEPGRQVTSPRLRPRGPLEQVAGNVIAGSNLIATTVCPFDEKGLEPPLATSSLKKRKKAKKDVH